MVKPPHSLKTLASNCMLGSSTTFTSQYLWTSSTAATFTPCHGQFVDLAITRDYSIAKILNAKRQVILFFSLVLLANFFTPTTPIYYVSSSAIVIVINCPSSQTYESLVFQHPQNCARLTYLLVRSNLTCSLVLNPNFSYSWCRNFGISPGFKYEKTSPESLSVLKDLYYEVVRYFILSMPDIA